MDRLLQLKQTIAVFLFAFALASYTLSPAVLAVTPAPDGGAATRQKGKSALLSLTTGCYNTAIGYLSLEINTTDSLNTAVGTGALFANTADQNTAIGAGHF